MKKTFVNGWEYEKKLDCFFELPISKELTLSIYDTEDGYEIEVIKDIDGNNEEVIDCMIYQTEKWERLKDLLYYAKNNSYIREVRKLIRQAIKDNMKVKEI